SALATGGVLPLAGGPRCSRDARKGLVGRGNIRALGVAFLARFAEPRLVIVGYVLLFVHRLVAGRFRREPLLLGRRELIPQRRRRLALCREQGLHLARGAAELRDFRSRFGARFFDVGLGIRDGGRELIDDRTQTLLLLAGVVTPRRGLASDDIHGAI